MTYFVILVRTMRQFLAISIFALSSNWAWADGIPTSNGRYTGPATLVSISSEQLREIGRTRRLELTPAQKAPLLASGQPAPSMLEVLGPREARFHCTCHTTNVAVWVTRNVVQVPHAFLRSDDDPAVHGSESATLRGAFPPPPLRIIGDVEGRLHINGRAIDLGEIDAFIQNSQPRVGHIIVLLPPRAADIPISSKQRRHIYKTMLGLAEKYQTDYGCFD